MGQVPSPALASPSPRSGRRKGAWLDGRDLTIALISGGIVAIASVGFQSHLDDRRSEAEERRENLRFVRSLATSDVRERPFQSIDLEGQPLGGLNLEDALLTDANLSGVSAFQASFEGADLSFSTAEEASFVAAKFNDAALVNGHFHASNFSGADLRGASLGGADLTDARFTASDLMGVDLRGADLHGADLAEARVSNICYDELTDWPEGFDPPTHNEESCDPTVTSFSIPIPTPRD